jgi:hypothetical protein
MNRLLLDCIEIDIGTPDDLLTVYVNVYDSSLSRKWLAALNTLIEHNYHLEKNYCFFGFPNSPRNAEYMLGQINQAIRVINDSGIYHIDDEFTIDNTIAKGPVGDGLPGAKLIQEHFNQLHRYFEDLQGTAEKPSPLYEQADSVTRWHIRQLNLLCHEFESYALSCRQQINAPEWQRPSQLMCWLNAPRFELTEEDYELFGIDTINRPLGGVFVGVNKAVGKHHFEVFQDEGRDSRIDELMTTTLKAQTLAAGDFDIEWANNPGNFPWQQKQLIEFKQWLINNGFDPEDRSLTIGHPQVGQVDLKRSFGTEDYQSIWAQLETRLNVHGIKSSSATAIYNYTWADADFMDTQIKIISGKTL